MKKIKLLLSLSFVLLLVSGTTLAQNLKIYCIDVDQGSSTLIVAPNNKSILIDCGLSGKADAVYKVVTDQAGLSSINYFLCTHYHDDHYGAIDKLRAKGIEITDKFYDRNSESWLGGKATETQYEQYAAEAEGKRKYLRPGRKINIDANVDIECFVANSRAKGEYGQIEYPEDENAYSIGLLIFYNGFDFLIAGDLTEEVERKLVNREVLKDVDVYHVSHHGSDTSSCSNFLDAIKPEVCIISSGSHGTYKHPRRNTIERLQNISSVQHIYQTNKNIKEYRYPETVKNVADEFIGDLDCDGDEGTILIEVMANNYTVKILSRGIEKSYNIEK
ncbi:MBL fold metallo-hydrolase [bacterium]|nr:MBL fold metallo-hydrolase [bacterium]